MAKIRLEDMTEPEIRNLMNHIARSVVRACDDMGLEGRAQFCLLLFNDPKISQYVSNCTRDSMIEAMRETVERLSNHQDVPRT